MAFLNLNRLAGGILAGAGVQPYEPCWWFKCIGQQNDAASVTPEYLPPVRLEAKIQSVKDDEETQGDDITERPIQRSLYVNSTLTGSVSGLERAEESGADYIFWRGAWWLVTAAPEDFSSVGWVRVIITQQVTGPEGVEPPEGA